jgi:hypothetical protein
MRRTTVSNTAPPAHRSVSLSFIFLTDLKHKKEMRIKNAITRPIITLNLIHGESVVIRCCIEPAAVIIHTGIPAESIMAEMYLLQRRLRKIRKIEPIIAKAMEISPDRRKCAASRIKDSEPHDINNIFIDNFPLKV